MSKSKKSYKKSKVFKSRSKKTKTNFRSKTMKMKAKKYRRKKNYKIGGVGQNQCCLCNNPTKDSMMTPNECLMKYGKYRSHKICSDCWWNKFAKEGVSHKCPGCQLGKPLNETENTLQQANNAIIDLTNDD